jgi:hypothetical protein
MSPILLIIPLALTLCGCTISIILTDTHGSATDVVDSTPTTENETDLTADVKPSAL